MSHACPTWEHAAAEVHLLKLHCLQNKIVHTTGNFPGCTMTRDLHVSFKILNTRFLTQNYARSKQKPHEIMRIKMYATLVKANPNTENIRDLFQMCNEQQENVTTAWWGITAGKTATYGWWNWNTDWVPSHINEMCYGGLDNSITMTNNYCPKEYVFFRTILTLNEVLTHLTSSMMDNLLLYSIQHRINSTKSITRLHTAQN